MRRKDFMWACSDPFGVDALPMATGAGLRAWRKRLGLTQDDLAMLLDMARPHICGMETDRRKIRRTTVLACIGIEHLLTTKRKP